MTVPGFSSPRVPVQVRLFIALSVTLALAPLLLPTLSGSEDYIRTNFAMVIARETAIGATIGLIGRAFFLALQFSATAAAMFVGFGGLPGAPIDADEPLPALASLITMTATVLIFLLDLHWEVIRALVETYEAWPLTRPFEIDIALEGYQRAISTAFFLTLQIISPFVCYTIAINLMFGLANKFTPQIPVYFISLPFVLAGGLLCLYFVVSDALVIFMQGFSSWLSRGL